MSYNSSSSEDVVRRRIDGVFGGVKKKYKKLKKKVIKFRIKVDNKLRGAYGETDYDKKLIRINKNRHKSKSAKRVNGKNGKESLLDTLIHEMRHATHPKATEKQVRTYAKNKVKILSKKQKSRIYSKKTINGYK